jgi:hypothetical protein
MDIGEGRKLSDGSRVKIESWYNPVSQAPMGNMAAGDTTPSFKNTGIFVEAWGTLMKSGVMWGKNWTVKVDPDAVFFPERLRWHVKKETWGASTTPKYYKNCDHHGPQLYGALEVFNEAAMRKYSQNEWSCTQQIGFGGMGEDEYIDKCMQKLGARQLIDYTLVGDHRCMSAECPDTWRAAFHDYKSVDAWANCYKTSINSQKAKRAQDKMAGKWKTVGAFCCTSGTDASDLCHSCYPSSKNWAGTDSAGFCGASPQNCKSCGKTAWCTTKGKASMTV